MAQTKFTLEMPFPRAKTIAKVDATFEVYRCTCGHCKNIVLELSGNEHKTGFALSQVIVLPLSALEFLVTECMGIMRDIGGVQ